MNIMNDNLRSCKNVQIFQEVRYYIWQLQFLPRLECSIVYELAIAVFGTLVNNKLRFCNFRKFVTLEVSIEGKLSVASKKKQKMIVLENKLFFRCCFEQEERTFKV